MKENIVYLLFNLLSSLLNCRLSSLLWKNLSLNYEHSKPHISKMDSDIH